MCASTLVTGHDVSFWHPTPRNVADKKAPGRGADFLVDLHIYTETCFYIRTGEERGDMVARNIMVIKIGGSVTDRLHSSFFSACVSLLERGWQLIIVHGGGPWINRWLEKAGITPRFVDGLRVTDADTLEVVEMVLAGSMNKHLVTQFEQAGARAIGISGVDGELIRVKQRDPALGYVGEVTEINPGILQGLLEQGWVPVVASLGVDATGQHYNINADHAAGAIAQALKAHTLALVTDVPGIWKVENGEKRVLRYVTPEQIDDMISDGTIAGGMIPKVTAGMQCLSGDVERVMIVDGRASQEWKDGKQAVFSGTSIVREW
jgi:acetylglutamate kinase